MKTAAVILVCWTAISIGFAFLVARIIDSSDDDEAHLEPIQRVGPAIAVDLSLLVVFGAIAGAIIWLAGA